MGVRARQEKYQKKVAERERDLEILRLKAKTSRMSRSLREARRDVERLERERERA